MDKETGSDATKSQGDAAAAAACLANAGALFSGLQQYDPRLLHAASSMMGGQRVGSAHSPLNAMGLNSASATWWSMASHLAAQDYLARLQASGISFPGMGGAADGVLPPSFPILSQQHTGSSAKSKIPEAPSRESFVLSESVSSSILGGVRLPPDTEIIKYTSSIVGPKIPGTTNRGRKKTISLDPPSVSLLATHAGTGLPIEHSPTALLTDRGMMSNGGCSSMQDSDAPLNLSLKPNSSSNSSFPKSSSPNNLAPLDFSSHSSSSSSSRISRRKPGPKPRRLMPPAPSYPVPPSEPSRLSPYYGTDDESTHHKDGRPRNLGRGISKPKKNTVASLLAQSRALGIAGDLDLSKYSSLKANLLQQQLEALTERAKTEERHEKKPLSVPNVPKSSESSHILNFSSSQHFEGTGVSEESGSAADTTDSSAPETDYEHQNGGAKRRKVDSELHTPLARGWRRDTFISAFTTSGDLNGDVAYTSPCETTFTRMQELLLYLKEKNITDLTACNFSFNPRALVGEFHQADPNGGFLKLSKQDIKNKIAALKAMSAKPPIEQKIEAEPLPAKLLPETSAIAMLKSMKLPTDRKRESNSLKEPTPSVSLSVSVSPSPVSTAASTVMPPVSVTMTTSGSSSPGLTPAEKQKKKEKREQQFMEMYIQELNKQREMLYTVELERERRRQHMALVKALEIRKRYEEREKKRLEVQAEKIASREKRIEERRLEIGLLYQIRKPTEDMEITDSKPLPILERIPGLQLSGQTFGELLMVHEFLNNFGETLGFDMESLPTLSSLQLALLGDEEAEEELLSVMTHLIICAIEDPGIPNPARHTTLLGQSLKQADITHTNISEILRVYLYANATGEVKCLTGACFEREREKRVSDHLNNLSEETNGTQNCNSASKNAAFFEALYDNSTWKMSEWLKTKSFVALTPDQKAQILACLCHELLQNKAVNKQIDNSMEEVAQHKRDRWATDTKIRKLKQAIGRKLRAGTMMPGPETPGTEAADEEEEDDEAADSDVGSEGTQPEEEEDKKLSIDELNRKLEKLIKQSEQNMQSLSEAASQLRATCFGEDRFYRRYWTLPAAGGIYVEAMESAEPEIYQQIKNEEKEEEVTVENDAEVPNDTAEPPQPVLEKVNDIKDIKEEETIAANENEDMEPPVLVKEEDVVVKPECDSEIPPLVNCADPDTVKAEAKMEVDEPDVKVEVKEEVNEGEPNEAKEEKMEVDEVKEGEVKTEEVKTEEVKTEEVKIEEVKTEEVKTEVDVKSDTEKAEEKLETMSNSSFSSSATDQAPSNQPVAEAPADFGWFTIMPKEPCDLNSVTTTSPGLRYGEGCTELRIPVFPPPASSPGPPDSPTPLMLTPDEAAQLAYMKEHGAPKKSVRKTIPKDFREGWWRITDVKQISELVQCLHPRGIRERELKRFITWPSIDQAWDTTLKSCSKSAGGLAKLSDDIATDEATRCEDIALRVDLGVLQQVEVLEEKVASSSMQVKGWKCPNRVSADGRNWAPAYCGKDSEFNPVALAKQRLAAVESAIERRYLKPPLGVSTGEVNHLQSLQGETLSPTDFDNIPKGLVTWREAVQKAQTAAQVSMALHMLEASIAWDRSIMKANCQFCHSGDCEDKLLLCDGCDKGYHTYCFKPKMEKIPEGDWFCFECLNKATGERNCIVCGKKFGRNLILCDQCPRAYHSDCLQPPLVKIPRSKWSCFNCQSKSPKKRSIRKSNVSTVTTPTISNGRSSTDTPPKVATPTSVPVPPPEPTVEEPPAKKVAEEPVAVTSPEPTTEPTPAPSAEESNKLNKKLAKEMAACKQLLEEMEAHDEAWPFLLPVNTKQFPTYKKVIKSPMDLSIIKKKLIESGYKSRTDFCNDVRLIFNNCETFNEDDSPVGKAGHGMRLFFESRWAEICNSKSS